MRAVGPRSLIAAGTLAVIGFVIGALAPSTLDARSGTCLDEQVCATQALSPSTDDSPEQEPPSATQPPASPPTEVPPVAVPFDGSVDTDRPDGLGSVDGQGSSIDRIDEGGVDGADPPGGRTDG